jgi:glyoxylase-like metal-dependent hydrolase (beta-lactamase superfamily II)
VPHETIVVGDVEISALLDVDVPDEPIADAFPAAPAEALRAAKGVYPSIYTPDDAWRLRVRSWLVRHGGGVLLLDTGVGPGSSPAMTWCPEPGATKAALAEVDAAPEDIDTVVISHTHDDHVGGVLGTDGNPAFPNARYVIQRADRDWERDAAAREPEHGATWTSLLEPLVVAGVLDVIDGDHRLTGTIELHHAPGHTPGHQVVRITSGDQRALLAADTWNHPLQLAHPEWASGSDDDGAAAEATRRALMTELLAQPETIVVPTHFGEAFGRVRTGPDGSPGWEASG